LDDYADYKLPADLFEALVGAVYECNGGTLGTGIEQAARFAVSYWKPYVGRPKRKKPHLIMFLDALTESLAAAPRTTKAEKRGGSEGKNNVLLFAGPGAFHPAGLILVALILGTAFFKDEILSSSWYKKLPNSWWGVAIRFVIINLPNHSDIRHQFVRFVSAAIDWLEDVLLRLPVSLSLPRSGHTLLRAA